MATKISYVDESWNPVIGCTKIAAGCKNCYAEKMACRLNQIFAAKDDVDNWAAYSAVLDFDYSEEEAGKPTGWNGNICCMWNRLDKPLHWKKPRRILVPSMGDLFHENVPFEFINKVFTIVAKCPRHKFFVLTKRPERMAKYFDEYVGVYVGNPAEAVHFPFDNLWLGTSISTQADADKNIPELLKMQGKKWLSLEPMIEGIDLLSVPAGDVPGFAQTRLRNHLHWVIVGCESGPARRPCKLEWIQNIVEQCRVADVPCYVKQVPINGEVSHNPEEWPKEFRVRQYPERR